MNVNTLQDNHHKISTINLTNIQCSDFNNLRVKLCNTNKLLYRGIETKSLADKLAVNIGEHMNILSKLFMYGEKAYSFFNRKIKPIDKQITKADIKAIFGQILYAGQTDYSQQNKDKGYLEFIAWFTKPDNELVFVDTIFNHPQAFIIILHYYQILHKLDETERQNNTRYPLISTSRNYAVAKDFVEADGYILTVIRPQQQLNDDKIKNIITDLELPIFDTDWIYSNEQEVSMIYGIAVDKILCVDVLHDGGTITYVNPNLFLPINAHLLKSDFSIKKGDDVSLTIEQTGFDIKKTNYHSFFYSQSFDRVCVIDDTN